MFPPFFVWLFYGFQLISSSLFLWSIFWWAFVEFSLGFTHTTYKKTNHKNKGEGKKIRVWNKRPKQEIDTVLITNFREGRVS